MVELDIKSIVMLLVPKIEPDRGCSLLESLVNWFVQGLGITPLS